MHTLLGAIIGILVLHPITKVVYWFEFRHELEVAEENLLEFLLSRLQSAFILEMMPMSLVFAIIGGSVGLAFGIYHLISVRQQRTVQYLEHQLAEDLPSLIGNGEGEHQEFKASIRWDLRQKKINRELEFVIAKTIVGFMNHNGGSLIIGVTDDGEISGLEVDYQTLKNKNRDGFERCLMDIVSARIGVEICSNIHCVFYQIKAKDVCRVIIEPSETPVYLKDGKISRYFLRAGCSTRELDAREAAKHMKGR